MKSHELDRVEHEVAGDGQARGVDDRGTGEPALLLVPGWCGDRTVLEGLASRLALSRRTLLVDLPGHGELRQDGETTTGWHGPALDEVVDVTTEHVVDDLVALLDRREVTRVVPVALSHAGWLALALRQRLGADRVPGLVLLDWMVLGPPPGFLDALGALQGPGWEEVRSALFALWAADLDLPPLHAYLAGMASYGRESWHRAGREIDAGFTEHGSPLAALQRFDAPPATLHLYAQPPDEQYLAAQQEFAEAHPWFTVRRLEARSHFPMFEVPDEMTTLIEDHVHHCVAG